MGRTNASYVSELLYVFGLLAAIALIVAMGKPSRRATDHDVAEREVIRFKAEQPNLPALAAENPADAMREQLRRSEESAKQAKKDLEAVRAEIEEKQAEIRKLSDESETTAARHRKETEETVRELAKERVKLENAAREASEKSQLAREEMARLNEALEKQRELAAQQGIAESLGRGRAVDMQTRFDPRTKRDPQMLRTVPDMPQGGVGNGQAGTGSITSLPAGVGEFSDGKRAINFETARSMGLDNRLKATETFFEMRRINRSARALEAGPRVTLEQAVRMARVSAPRRLSDLELDPITGEIAWPSALTEEAYATDKVAVQDKFHDRAGGVSMDSARFNSVNNSISTLKMLLKDNIDRYVSSHYGKAKSFLDSLLYEFEAPLR